METTRRMHSGVPYQYKVNTKKRAVAVSKAWQIEEILHMTYERNMRGPRVEVEGKTPIHISVSVEPINPCVTNIPRRTPPFRQPNLGRRKTT
jgi:hypothetical protein